MPEENGNQFLFYLGHKNVSRAGTSCEVSLPTSVKDIFDHLSTGPNDNELMTWWSFAKPQFAQNERLTAFANDPAHLHGDRFEKFDDGQRTKRTQTASSSEGNSIRARIPVDLWGQGEVVPKEGRLQSAHFLWDSNEEDDVVYLATRDQLQQIHGHAWNRSETSDDGPVTETTRALLEDAKLLDLLPTTLEFAGSVHGVNLPRDFCSCAVCGNLERTLNPRKEDGVLLRSRDTDPSVVAIDPTREHLQYEGDQHSFAGIVLTYGTPQQLREVIEHVDDTPVYCTDYVKQRATDIEVLDRQVQQVDPELRVLDSTETWGELDVEPQRLDPDASHGNMKSYDNIYGVALTIEGLSRSLYYVVARDRWTDQILNGIRGADTAVVNAPFWIPEDTEQERSRYREKDDNRKAISLRDSMMADLAEIDTEIYFTKFDHTNEILREDRTLKDAFKSLQWTNERAIAQYKEVIPL